jgi:hypothetical protein
VDAKELTARLLAAKAQAAADTLYASAAGERDPLRADELWDAGRREEKRARALIGELDEP